MDRIWAPWRKAYIRPSTHKTKGCLFCKLEAASQTLDAKNYILKRTAYNFAILNLYPYNNGHAMIIPRRHVARIEKLTNAEKLDWLALYEEVQAAMEKTLRPHGFNIGMNLGISAGAGIPNHAHLHIVPRWKGDSNFMPVVAGTKVISESLDSVHQILSKALTQGARMKSGMKR